MIGPLYTVAMETVLYAPVQHWNVDPVIHLIQHSGQTDLTSQTRKNKKI